jgi:hypothetical protein
MCLNTVFLTEPHLASLFGLRQQRPAPDSDGHQLLNSKSAIPKENWHD